MKNEFMIGDTVHCLYHNGPNNLISWSTMGFVQDGSMNNSKAYFLGILAHSGMLTSVNMFYHKVVTCRMVLCEKTLLRK